MPIGRRRCPRLQQNEGFQSIFGIGVDRRFSGLPPFSLSHPTNENPFVGTPVNHPTNEDPFVGTPANHPTNEDPFVGTPVKRKGWGTEVCSNCKNVPARRNALGCRPLTAAANRPDPAY